jgi:carbamoyl-phosphate synthase large subunit
MNTNKIAITGVGGGVCQSIIKSLYNTDYELVGLDGELLGAGLYTVPTSYLIPYARTKNFIPSLLEICEKEKIRILFPGLDMELGALSENAEKFKAIGTTVIVSDKRVIQISDDKLETFNKLTAIGINVPHTLTLESFNLSSSPFTFPFIIKQQIDGARSKNVFLIKGKEDFEKVLVELMGKNEKYIVQEYIDGDEYTCGSINLDSKCKGVIVMRRRLRDGDTYKCFTEKNEAIEKAVREIMEKIKPFGACNVQLRLKEGIPYVFEINARCSGTTAARTLSGFNEPKMIADYLIKGIEPSFDIKPVTILRYWKELVVENEDINELSNAGFHKKEVRQYL